MAETSLLKKLRVKQGQRMLLLNPESHFLDKMGDLPEGVQLESAPNGTYDIVMLFVKDSAELEEFKPVIMKAIKYDGLLWISYPKGSSKMKSDLS